MKLLIENATKIVNTLREDGAEQFYGYELASCIEELINALQTQVTQEPYGYYWIPSGRTNGIAVLSKNTGPCEGWTVIPLYTAPPAHTALLRQSLEALTLYVEEDDVCEGMEGNEFWVDIKRKAETAIAAIKKVINDY
jgi:hypothetical protein